MALLVEIFSNASYMDVRELRSMYYGRINMYVSFSDTDRVEYKPKRINGAIFRPTGIFCHSVDSVVGRKVSTPKLYGHVLRVRKDGSFVDDIRTYTSEQLKADIKHLQEEYGMDAELPAKIENRMSTRRPFERLWTLTRILSDGNADKWTEILLSLGYTGFEDQSGLGILSTAKVPCALVLDAGEATFFDIVPMQKYRKEERARIRDNVDRKVDKMETKRNRVAKKEPNEEIRNTKRQGGGLSDLLKALVGVDG